MKQFAARLAACLIVLSVFISPLLAMSASAAGSSSSLSITPRKDYIIKPGQTVKDKLSIGNLSKTDDLTVSIKMIDFSFTNSSGTPKLFLADNAPQTAWSLKPFTTLPKSVTVPAGQTKRVDYSITLPKNQGAGSYYSAIMYQAGGDGSGGNVNLNASGVTLAFVSVPGIVHEDMKVTKFGAYTPANQGLEEGKFIYIALGKAPQTMAYKLKNDGNVAESPAGSITLKDMFGREVKSIGSTNTTGALALIGQTRLFSTCIKTVQQKIQEQGGTSSNLECTDPGLIPGRYTAFLDIYYGQNGNQTHEVTATASFWYLPIWFLVLLLAVILIIVWFILWLRRKIRRALGKDTKSSRFTVRRR